MKIRITILSYIFLVLLLELIPIVSLAQSEQSIRQQADSLYNMYDDKQALNLYEKILDQDPDDYSALWKTSLLYSRIGNRFENDNDKQKYFEQAIEHAERALKIDSTGSQSNFVMGIAMGRKALISGARDRVAASRQIKKYADRAIASDSTNAGAWHLLGRWNFRVDNLGWFERAAANTLFGGIPDASTEKAAQYIQKAIALNDRFVLYYYDLANVYRELGKDQQAISICRQAQNVPALAPNDEEIKQDCKELIKDLK